MCENLRQLRHVLAELAPCALLQALELPGLIVRKQMPTVASSDNWQWMGIKNDLRGPLRNFGLS